LLRDDSSQEGYSAGIFIKGIQMNISNLPNTGLISLREILGDVASKTPAIIPVSRTTWWRGIKSGIYPQGIKISARRTAWRAEDIQALINSFK